MRPPQRMTITRAFVVLALVLVSLASLPWTPSARAAVYTPATVTDLIVAINTANANAGADEIVLTAGATYALTYEALVNFGLVIITSEITITGNGATITRDSAAEFRILQVQPGGNLTLNQVTISNGSIPGANGGGILNFGTLTLNDSTVSGNSATYGGGIYNDGGPLTLTNSTVSGNSGVVYATEDRSFNPFGAGIFSDSGAVTLINSTVSGNSAGSSGNGGGILNSGTMALANTIVAGNTASINADIVGAISDTAGGHNLIGDGTGMTGLVNGVNGNQVGTFGAAIDPLLGPLADNDGPTLTMMPLDGSPAIDAGNDAIAPDTDQRGFGRFGSTASDIGAVEANSLSHADLCAMTQEYVNRASVARSACMMLEIASRSGTSSMAEMAMTNYRVQIRSAMSRRYVSTAHGNELIALSYQL